MADISFMTPGLERQPGIYTQNPDYTVQAQEIARRRALSDALLARSLQPLPEQAPVGGLAVPISPLQGISGLVQQFFAAKMGKDLSGQEADLSKRYIASRGQGLQRLLENPESVPHMIAGMAETDPAISGISKLLLENRLKGQITPKDLLTAPGTSVQSRVGAIGGAGAPALRSEPKTMDVGGNLVETTPGQAPVSKGYFGPTSGPPVTIPSAGGPVTGQFGQQTGKFEDIAKTPRININNLPPNKFGTVNAEEQAKLIGKAVSDSRAGAQGAAGDMKILGSAIQAYNAGISTGSLQAAGTAFSKFAESTGFKSADPKVSNTDTFMKTMSSRILQHTKELRPLSDTDRQFLEDILAGRNLTDQSLRRLLQLGVEQAQGTIEQHNALVKKYGGFESSIPGVAEMLSIQTPQGIPAIGSGVQPKGTLKPYTGPR